MDTKQNTSSRRDVIKTMFRSVGVFGLGGMAWAGAVDKLKASELTLRPPGALLEKDFVKACIRCGTCVEACPYNTLVLATPDDYTAIGTPYFKPRNIPCYMCVDIPCVPVCPSGALDAKLVSIIDETNQSNALDINKAKMGVVVIDEETCVAFWGIQCDACYRACPLIGNAISLEFKRNERTGKHAFMQPVVHQDVCTGCGMCEHACITEKPAIFVLPEKIGSGKVGSHYIKGWDKNDENRLNNHTIQYDNNESSPEDVLNNLDDLIDN